MILAYGSATIRIYENKTTLHFLFPKYDDSILQKGCTS